MRPGSSGERAVSARITCFIGRADFHSRVDGDWAESGPRRCESTRAAHGTRQAPQSRTGGGERSFAPARMKVKCAERRVRSAPLRGRRQSRLEPRCSIARPGQAGCGTDDFPGSSPRSGMLPGLLLVQTHLRLTRTRGPMARLSGDGGIPIRGGAILPTIRHTIF